MSQPQPSASVRAYFESPNRPRRSYFSTPLVQLRQRYYEEFIWGGGPTEEVSRIEQISAEGVRGTLYLPAESARTALVWFHGGGWNLGSVACHDRLCRAMANRSGAAVLSVEYRLAPESPYPAAVIDAWVAALWAHRRFDSIAVGGDSAGGTLAAATALRARNSGILIALQLLVYPVLDYRPAHASYMRYTETYEDFGPEPGFGREFQETIADIWQQYIPDPVRRGEPDASPLRTALLANVAPVHMVIAEHDILKPEEIEYAYRLRQEGVSVTIDEYEGQIHGFFPLLGVMPEARTAVDRAARAVSRALTPSEGSRS